jgi:NAD dependent epimerase/dehydratase family enzyme
LPAERGDQRTATRAVGIAIAQAARPPRVWLQMSTATIYAHRFDAPNDEGTGRIGGGEPGAPARWATSVEIAKAWERALEEAPTPATRKVALRSAMVMSPDRDGIFDVLLGLVRRGLGGAVGAINLAAPGRVAPCRAARVWTAACDKRFAAEVSKPPDALGPACAC